MYPYPYLVGLALICSFQKSPRNEEAAIELNCFPEYRSFNSIFCFIRSPTEAKKINEDPFVKEHIKQQTTIHCTDAEVVFYQLTRPLSCLPVSVLCLRFLPNLI